MKILQTNSFIRAAKKLNRNQIPALKDAIEFIRQNPLSGELKKGDLAGIRVHKFHILHQLILLAYSFNEEADELILVSFGSHENFYKKIKREH